MARLGELLVAAGLVTADQVERGLRAQVMWGGRLGTNLVELENLDLDALSKMLARQLRVPAALARHFEKGDRALQARLPAAMAERHRVVPLVRIGAKQEQIAIAVMNPLDGPALSRIADALGVRPAQLVPSIAPELRIAYHLERVYQIPRDLRFLRPRNKAVPAFLHFEVIPVPPDSEPELVLRTGTLELPVYRPPADPDAAEAEAEADEAAELEPRPARPGTASGELALALPDDDEDEEEPDNRERRKYVRTIADEPSTESERQAVGRIALRRVAIAGAHGAAGETLVEATRAIRRSTDRDKVADLVMDAIDRFVPACDAAILLVKRGDVAIGWKGFGRGRGALPEIGVPLDQPSVVARAIDGEQTTRVPAADLGPIDEILRCALGGTGTELAIVPISIGGQVMCAIALVAAPRVDLACAESIAGAAGAAFARLMRDASR